MTATTGSTRDWAAELSIPDLTDDQVEALDRDGFFIVEDVFTPEQCDAMAAAIDEITAVEGGNAGGEVSQEAGISRRLSNLFNKSDAFDALIAIGPSLAAARHLLGEFRLHGANIREPLEGAGQQPLHSDVPKDDLAAWQLVNTMVAIDDVTEDNGPTRVVPGSHRWPFINVPVENLYNGQEGTDVSGDTSRIPADPHAQYDGERYVTMRRGSLAIINGHLWHSGTTNRSGARRRLGTISYSRRDIPQQVSQREVLTDALDARLDNPTRWLLDVL